MERTTRLATLALLAGLLAAIAGPRTDEAIRQTSTLRPAAAIVVHGAPHASAPPGPQDLPHARFTLAPPRTSAAPDRTPRTSRDSALAPASAPRAPPLAA